MEDPAGPPPMMATSKSGFVITNASSWKFLKNGVWLPLLTGLLERVYGHVTQQFVPRMFSVLLHLGNHFLHFLEHWWRGIVVNIALQQFEYVQPITGVAHEIGEEHIQSVVHRNKFVPVLGPEAQLGLVLGEAFAREIILFKRAQYVGMSEAGAVQSDADSSGENRVHEAPGIADQHEAVATKLLHGIAVVAFIFEVVHLIRLLQFLPQQRTRSHRFPEKLFPVLA